MNPSQLLAHFDRISDAPDAILRLRQFILCLAVRGQLIRQCPNDEPAPEFLKRIKLKGADNEPFLIPPSWSWISVGQIGESRLGKMLDKAKNKGTLRRYLRNVNVRWFGFDLSDVFEMRFEDDELEEFSLRKGDVLICEGGEPGRAAVWDEREEKIYFQKAIHRVRFPEGVNSHFFLSALRESADSRRLAGYFTGVAIKHFTGKGLSSFIFPLPPLAEQHRIVAKVAELMALCDELEVARTRRETRRDQLTAASWHSLSNGANSASVREHARFCFSHFPHLTKRPAHIHQLRQTLLNLAVRGRLVPQDATDEPAAQLLTRIRMAQLQPGKKAKSKIKPALPPLDSQPEPFELPSGWTWARFPELGQFGRGKSKHRPRNDSSLFEGGSHLLVQTGDVARSNGLIKTFTNKYNDVGLAQSAKWPKGTLCITIAANIADSGILTFDACFPDSVVGFIPAPVFPNARYFEYFIRTAKADLLEFAPATAQKNINLEILNAVLIPLPPLGEQQRIVTRVDELMDLCDRLEKELIEADAKSSLLLEAVLHHALNTGLQLTG
jgi:type I restriction enzyme S subunit